MKPYLLGTVLGIGLLACGQSASAQTARLILERVLGAQATSLTVPFGPVDAQCTTAPAAGVACSAQAAGAYATWYGSIQFRVRLTAFPGGRVRLTGQRLAGGSMPAGRLMDSASGVPATAYPTAPAAPLTLATAIGSGNSLITRVIGVRVLPVDAAAAWNTQIVYSLVVE